jgi:hypothetical protein
MRVLTVTCDRCGAQQTLPPTETSKCSINKAYIQSYTVGQATTRLTEENVELCDSCREGLFAIVKRAATGFLSLGKPTKVEEDK